MSETKLSGEKIIIERLEKHENNDIEQFKTLNQKQDNQTEILINLRDEICGREANIERGVLKKKGMVEKVDEMSKLLAFPLFLQRNWHFASTVALGLIDAPLEFHKVGIIAVVIHFIKEFNQ